MTRVCAYSQSIGSNTERLIVKNRWRQDTRCGYSSAGPRVESLTARHENRAHGRDPERPIPAASASLEREKPVCEELLFRERAGAAARRSAAALEPWAGSDPRAQATALPRSRCCGRTADRRPPRALE